MLFDFSINEFFNDAGWLDVLTEQRMLWVYVATAFLGVAYLILRILRVKSGQ